VLDVFLIYYYLLSSVQGELRAICGGGRYDHLLDSFTSGSKSRSIPAVGFGFGDAVIVELLKSRGLLPDVSTIAVVDVVVCALVVDDTAVQDNNTLQQLAIRAAKSLRDKGLAVDLVLEKKRAKWMFQRADRLNAGMSLE
jgi:histidyl-tRNA synthetase